MGGMFSKPPKNYQLPYLAHKKASELVPTILKTPLYQSHLMKEENEVPCYSLKQKKAVNFTQLQDKVYKKPSELRLLTYNVWFEGHNVQNRYPVILRILAESGADVICLQEVNQRFLQLLHAPTGAYKQLEDYYIPNMKMNWYDTIILTRFPCRFYKKIFDTSMMGRCALAAVCQFAEQNEKKVKIGINCVHLQSLENSQERVNQLEKIQKMNKDMDVSIIAGDFNFSDGWQENKAIEGYTDLWKKGKRHFSKWATQKQKETGFTMPSSNRFPAWRPDHVIYRSSLKKQEESDQGQLEIIGDFTVNPYENEIFDMLAKDGQVRTPSDHFGLLARIPL